ncbi:hypothetical protein EDB80DRAFT_24044 [Ilyonectria destructans]|nr:hypothetical protein EDB80DRAFT_24044 [Ilyonectria destructans]
MPISVPIRGLVLSLALSASSFAATTLGLFLATRSLLISWTLSSQLDVTNITMFPCTVHYVGITRLLRSYFILRGISRSLLPISRRHLSTPQPSAISPAGSRVQKPKPSRIMIPKVLVSCTLTVFMHACIRISYGYAEDCLLLQGSLPAAPPQVKMPARPETGEVSTIHST